nr:unnamed protein product [Naegleria fowleri]
MFNSKTGVEENPPQPPPTTTTRVRSPLDSLSTEPSALLLGSMASRDNLSSESSQCCSPSSLSSSYIISTTPPPSSSSLPGTISVFPSVCSEHQEDDPLDPLRQQQIRKNRSRTNSISFVPPSSSEFLNSTHMSVMQHSLRSSAKTTPNSSLALNLSIVDPNLFLNQNYPSPRSSCSSRASSPSTTTSSAMSIRTLLEDVTTCVDTDAIPLNVHAAKRVDNLVEDHQFYHTQQLATARLSTPPSLLSHASGTTQPFTSNDIESVSTHHHSNSASTMNGSSSSSSIYSDTPALHLSCGSVNPTSTRHSHDESSLTTTSNTNHSFTSLLEKLVLYTATIFSSLLPPKMLSLLREESQSPSSPEVHSENRMQSLQDDESLIIKFKSRHEELAKNNPKLMICIAVLLLYMTYFFIDPTTHSYVIFWLGFVVEMSMNITVDHILCTTQTRREFSIINVAINMVGTCVSMHVAALWEFQKTNDEFIFYATKTKILETMGLQFILFATSYQFSYMMERQGDENTKKQLEILKQQIVNTSKTKFIGKLSHEARNPLQGILSSVQLLQNEINTYENQVFSQALKETLDDIYYNSTLLLHIFSTSLQLTNLELGSIKLNEQKFSLLECLENMVSVFFRAADEKGISIGSCYNFNSLSKYNFLGDQPRVAQILMNIISNAVKFTEKGMVFLSCDICTKSELNQLKIREDPEYSYVKIICEDTGIGMSKNTQQNLFKKPFHRIDADTVNSAIHGNVENFNPIFEQYFVNSLSRNSDIVIDDKSGSQNEGSTRGFGISISKSLLDLMGGKIFVSSELGRGTKVTIILPLKNLPLSEQVDAITSDFEYNSDNRSISACSKELHEAVHYCIPDFYVLDSNPLTPVILKPYLSFIFPSSKILITDNAEEIKDKLTSEQKFSTIIYNQAVCDSRAFEPVANDCVLIPMNNRGRYTEHRYLSRPIRFKDLLEVLLFYVKSRPVELTLMNTFEKSSSNLSQNDDDIPQEPVQKAALVVEDNDINRKVLAKMLRVIGFKKVDCCENGLDGVEKFKQNQNQYGLILMDLLMPVMNGKEACCMISQLQNDSSIKTPVIAVTANIWETKEQLLSQGFSDVLYKPITLENLKNRLSEFIQ